MSKKTKTQQEYISAYQFAERKGVSSTAVYDRMETGDIEVVMMGKRKFIDWEKFKHVVFPHAERYKKDETPSTNETESIPLE